MFGKNEVTSSFQDAEPYGSLLINEIYYTIQGEGPDSGRPAIFVRLAKCNLRCFWCDTEFETGTRQTLDEITDWILEEANSHKCDLAVVTGGEPLLQNIVPLTAKLNEHGISVSIETAGTVWLANLDMFFNWQRSLKGNLIVISPKTPKLNKDVLRCAGALKYIVQAGWIDDEDGLPTMSTQTAQVHQRVYRPGSDDVVPVYLQPLDEDDDEKNADNRRAAAAACLKHGYRLSLQTHKLCDLR